MAVTEAGAPGRPALRPEDQPKLERLRAQLREFKGRPGSTLEALFAAQALFSYVPPEAISTIAEELRIPESQVFGVATFYTMFYLAPQPKHILRVCRDLSCHLAGAQGVFAALEQELEIRRGEVSGDSEFKIEAVSCLGLCDKQPAMSVNLDQRGPIRPGDVPVLIRELRDGEV
jgi:NADH:ubiquinone oxidoreductase subunit E